jgi:CrcB protein
MLGRTYLLIGIGGALGATLRWGLGRLVVAGPGEWPWATLVVNVVGSLLIGLAVRRLDRTSALWSMWVVGGLGGFTTMSTFAGELNDLVDAGRGSLAVAYGVTSVIAGFLAVWIGTGAVPVPEAVVEDTE